ncbi:hypothetical protein LCGC14_1247100 [marine sediment metagenome]|uniref:Uncharacterized protein n=1 Tax=marine sediment metagenome TaxID=412755 RepID=A0A0F9L469_9ZZZZ
MARTILGVKVAAQPIYHLEWLVPKYGTKGINVQAKNMAVARRKVKRRYGVALNRQVGRKIVAKGRPIPHGMGYDV